MCLCFSTDRLTHDELNGKYGAAYGPFIEYNNNFQVSLCKTPCKEPCCWLASMMCLCPASMHMWYKALNHVTPGSGWSNYKCCQGYFGGCCCLEPGSMGESTCPIGCMCLEAFCCIGPAVSATSNVIREHYSLGLDDDDVRLIRCSNCLFFLSCFCSFVACLTECEGDDQVASVIDLIADVVFCFVSGCMNAQTHHAIKIRASQAPTGLAMQRF